MKLVFLIVWDSLLFTIDAILKNNARESIYIIILGKKLSLRQYLFYRLWLKHPNCPEVHRLSFSRWPVLKPVKIV